MIIDIQVQAFKLYVNEYNFVCGTFYYIIFLLYNKNQIINIKKVKYKSLNCLK